MIRRHLLLLLLLPTLLAGGRASTAAADPSASHRRAAHDPATAVPVLLSALRHGADDPTRARVRSALVSMGEPAVPFLVDALAEWPDSRRRELVVLLAVIGPPARAAVPTLKELLRSSDTELRQSAAFALNNIQPGSATPDEESTITPVAARVTTETMSREPRTASEITPATQPAADAEPRRLPQAARQAVPLRPSSRKMREETPESRSATTPDWLGNEWTTGWTASRHALAAHRPEIIYVLQWIGLIYAGWLLTFFLLPITLTTFDLWLRRPGRSWPERVLVCWLIPLRGLLLLPWLCRSQFAVSAWIDDRSHNIVNRFWAGDGIRHHAGYVNAPLRINGQFREQLRRQDLRLLRRQCGAVIHIAGPPGSGKSALAVELAGQAAAGMLGKSRRLPIVLRPAAGQDLKTEVRRQLLDLVGIFPADSARFAPLIQQIAQRHLLLVAEAPDDRDAAKTFAAEARALAGDCPLIVVAADPSLPLPQVDLRLQPLAPEGDRLRLFVDDYLSRRGLHNLDDGDWPPPSRGLSPSRRHARNCQSTSDNGTGTLPLFKMKRGSARPDALDRLCRQFGSLRTARPLPMQLLQMFLDQFLRHRAHGVEWNPPASISQLLRQHVEWQLTKAAGSGFEPDELRRDVDELARMSLAKDFSPRPVRRDALLKNLAGPNAAQRLKFLEHELLLIEAAPGQPAAVRFRSGLLAARLAADLKRATLDLGAHRWTTFLRQLQTAARKGPGTSTNSERQQSRPGPALDACPSTLVPSQFALALYDCCLDSTAARPEAVLLELGEIAGLDPEQTEQDLREQQSRAERARLQDVAAIVHRLDDESPAVRRQAVTALGEIGLASVDVVTKLIKALTDVDDSVRRAASAALGQLRGTPESQAPHAFRRRDATPPAFAGRSETARPARAA